MLPLRHKSDVSIAREKNEYSHFLMFFSILKHTLKLLSYNYIAKRYIINRIIKNVCN